MLAFIIALSSVMGVMILAFFILVAISHLYFKRSVMATLAEIYLHITEKRLSDDEVRAGIPLLPLKNDVDFSVPKNLKKKLPYKKRVLDGMQVFTFYGSEKTDTAIMYLHGAGYVRPPRKHHWKFAIKLAKATKSAVVFAIYPKAPNYDYKLSYKILPTLYGLTLNQYKHVALMGDSSGGGLALGLCAELTKLKLPQPEKLILLSPWADVSLTNPDLKSYERFDPIVSITNERIWGECWANGTDVKDPKISPIYCKFKELAPVYIFVGTRETLYPDVLLLGNALQKQGFSVKLYKGIGLNHVYPIYPIPEAKKTLKIISEIINIGDVTN